MMQSTASPFAPQQPLKKRKRTKEEKKKRPPPIVKSPDDALAQYTALLYQRERIKEQYDDMRDAMKDLEPHFRQALKNCPGHMRVIKDGKIMIKQKKKKRSYDKLHMIKYIAQYIIKRKMVAAGPNQKETAKSIAADMTNYIIDNEKAKEREVIEYVVTSGSKGVVGPDKLAALELDLGLETMPAVPGTPIVASQSAGSSSRMDL